MIFLNNEILSLFKVEAGCYGKPMKYSYLLFFFLSLQVQAIEISCTHPQVCNLLKASTANLKDIEIKQIEIKFFDPHHPSLRPSQVKTLLAPKYLVLPPKSLSPWVSPLSKKRENSTYIMQAHNAENGHFWLYTHALCHSRQEILTLLRKWNQSNIPLSPDCEPELKIHDQYLKLKTLFKSYVIVLTHEGLTKQLEEVGLKVLNLSESGHHHHGSVSPKALKHILKYQDQGLKILQIKESQLPANQQKLPSKVKVSKTISLDTLGAFATSPLKVLENLLEEFQEIEK